MWRPDTKREVENQRTLAFLPEEVLNDTLRRQLYSCQLAVNVSYCSMLVTVQCQSESWSQSYEVWSSHGKAVATYNLLMKGLYPGSSLRGLQLQLNVPYLVGVHGNYAL